MRRLSKDGVRRIHLGTRIDNASYRIVHKLTHCLLKEKVLFLQDRVSPFTLGAGIVDLIFGVLFVAAYLKTPSNPDIAT